MLLNRTITYFDAVICLDAITGNEIWRKEWPGSVSPYAGAANVGASGTPAIWNDKCYVAGSAGMYCLSVKDGSVIWQERTGFSNSSPLIKDGIVYVLVPVPTAYDGKTGRVLWRQPGLRHPNSSFATWTCDGKMYLIISIEGGVYSSPGGGIYCVDPADGKVLWTTFCPGASIPVMTGDTLIMESSHDNTLAFKITPAKAEKLWETKRTGGTRGESPVIYQDHVYISGGCHSDNPLRCLDLKTGQIMWNPHSGFAAEASSPVLVDGKIIALVENSENSLFAVMYRATPEKYEELGRFNPDAGPGASPVVVAGRLYLRLQDGVACYDLTTPAAAPTTSAEERKPAPSLTSPTHPPLSQPNATAQAPGIKTSTPPTANIAIRGWRGDGTGHFAVAMPPTEWNEGKNVVWRAEIGIGNSTPVACGNKIFVTSEKCTLACVDRKGGQVLWTKTTRPQDAPGEYLEAVREGLERSQSAGLASSTPICDGHSVFVVFGTGEISRYDLEGNRKWFRLIKPAGLNYGHSASPLLEDGKLVVSLDGLAALDARTGLTIWENKTVKPAHGSPVLMMLGSTRAVVTPTGYVVRLSDGKILAKDIANNLQGDEFSISPIVHDDVVYYIDSSCTAVKLALEGEEARTKTLWTADLSEAAIASPVFHDGLIFACTTMAHYSVLDSATGKPVLVDSKTGKLIDDCILEIAPAGGSAREPAKASIYPSVTVAGNCVYISNDRGQTFVLDASKTFKEVRRNNLPEGSGASLFFDGPEAFIRGGDHLYCVRP
jgi:outer membrane protein assembly factor BamB